MTTELAGRVATLQSMLRDQAIDGVFLLDRISLFYYFGTIPGGSGYIPAEGEPCLFIRRGQARAAAESPWPIEPMTSFRSIQPVFATRSWSAHRRVGLEFDRIPVNLYQLLRKNFPAFEFEDISRILREQRAIKSDLEIGLLREAGIRAGRSFARIPELLRRGRQTELEVMADFEAVMRKNGHQGIVRLHAFNGEIYYGAFAAGDSANAAIVFDGPVGTPGLSPAAPFLCSNKLIRPGEPILVDVVFGWQGYIVDQSRVYSFGDLPEPLPAAHATALTIQRELVALMKPGHNGQELYERAIRIASEAGFAANFMGSPQNRVGFVGHGVGLELDELPVLAPGFTAPLQSNMIIALEPKFFFPGLGGVGIENTFRVTPEGGENLTDFPDDIMILPAG